jgi:hypothetical protein
VEAEWFFWPDRAGPSPETRKLVYDLEGESEPSEGIAQQRALRRFRNPRRARGEPSADHYRGGIMRKWPWAVLRKSQSRICPSSSSSRAK